ncbi:hypothetical protein EDB80DRAFT_231878 [Ilyonectria destructans]|nr:hypothetical protein EDB80DRAFT_231878 [Ilyonectria destructans]
MFVEQLEAVAHCILAQCKRAKSDGPESIDDDTILKVLNDFSYEAITISPEPRHRITQSLSPGWKDAIVAIVNLFKLFNLTATCPTTTASTTTPTTTPAATAPTATTSTITPASNVSTATAPTAVAPTTTTATTAPTLIPPNNTPEKKHSGKRKKLAVSKEISENVETWKHSPEKLFDQDSILLQGLLCDYIKKVSNSDILNTLRLRFAKRRLFQQRKLWTRKATDCFLQHLKDRGVAIDKDTFGRWIREGNTYELFVQTWGNGSLLATDLTAYQAEIFPRGSESRKSRLDTEASRGLKNLADKYNDTGTALWSYISKIPFTDNFVPECTTSLTTARKRRSSQTLTHQDRRPFRIDKTPTEFAQQPELVSSPVTTQIGDVAEREAAPTDGFTTRDAGGGEGSRLEVENLQWSSPTAPAQYQPVAEPSPRSASSSLDRAFTEDDCQRPLNRGTDRSAYSGHRNDRIDERQSPRTRDVPQHPQVPGDVSSHSPTTHSVPATTAIQSRIAEPPASNPRSGSQSHVYIQEPSASPQHDRQSEPSPTHQPKLPSPEPREEAKTNDGGLGSAQQPSTQNLSLVQPHSLEPISGATERSCYPQYGNSPPHPLQTVPDPTVIQRYGTSIQEAPSSQQLLESSETGLPHQPAPSSPPNVSLTLVQQNQSPLRTTSSVLMAAEVTELSTGIWAHPCPALEFRPENTEDRGRSHDASRHPPSPQGPRGQRSAVEPSEKANTAGNNTSLRFTGNPVMTQDPSPAQPNGRDHPPRSLSASASPSMAAPNDQAGRVTHQMPRALDVREYQARVPVNADLPETEDSLQLNYSDMALTTAPFNSPEILPNWEALDMDAILADISNVSLSEIFGNFREADQLANDFTN